MHSSIEVFFIKTLMFWLNKILWAKSNTSIRLHSWFRCPQLSHSIRWSCSNDGLCFPHLQKSQQRLSLEHEHYFTALTTVAHVAHLAPEQFLGPMKTVIAGTIVKGILMQDRTEGSKSKGIWCHDDQLCEETQGKVGFWNRRWPSLIIEGDICKTYVTWHISWDNNSLLLSAWVERE